MYDWIGFKNGFQSFTDPELEGVPETADVLHYSLAARRNICNEDGETSYIVDQVLVRLQTAGLLKQGAKNQALLWKHSKGLGNADHFLIVGDNETVPIEFKATHNLLVPNEAVEVVLLYNRAFKKVNETLKRTIEWVNIGHPVAQIINYMVRAGSRYGVLSCGSRTYFLKVEEGPDGDPRVFISDAWFIGEVDYLRAWAYMYHLAKGNCIFRFPVNLPTTWLPETPGR